MSYIIFDILSASKPMKYTSFWYNSLDFSSFFIRWSFVWNFKNFDLFVLIRQIFLVSWPPFPVYNRLVKGHYCNKILPHGPFNYAVCHSVVSIQTYGLFCSSSSCRFFIGIQIFKLFFPPPHQSSSVCRRHSESSGRWKGLKQCSSIFCMLLFWGF